MYGFDMTRCRLCPRACLADRTKGKGFCGGGAAARLARAALHFWEEPVVSGKNGSGAVFFSGCPLQCAYCQNHGISAGNFGKEIPVRRLSEIFLELQQQGAHNINLVTPTHYVPWILEALGLARPALKIPVVYNCGGYESVETLRALEGFVDVYMPDLKYMDAALSAKYSGAADYFARASEAVLEMFRQVGPARISGDGLLTRGLLIRHLVLPGAHRDSLRLLGWIAGSLPKEEILVSVMRQYAPPPGGTSFPELNRRLTSFEYEKAADEAARLSLSGFIQEKGSAGEGFTPDFDLTGL